MSTKIQINSVAAIERLIGDDNETELEIRKSVVAEFCARHLSKLVPQVMEQHKTQIEARVNAALSQAASFTGRYTYCGGGYQLDDAFKLELNVQVRQTVKDEINRAARAAMEEWQATMVARLHSAMEHELKHLVQARLAKVVADEVSEADLGAMMTAAVRERLSKK